MRRIYMQFLYFGWLGHGNKLLLKYTLPALDTKKCTAGIQYLCTFMGPTLSQKLRLFTRIYSRIFRGYDHSKYNFGTAAYTNGMKALII
jgi:hypothetical protein